MLLELLRDSESRRLVFNPANLAFAINEPDVALVERVIKDYALFDAGPDGTIGSPWLEAQLAEYDAKKAAAVEAGRRGAAKRYGRPMPEQEGSDRVPIAPLCPPPSGAHSNITNNINQINPTQSKSKLLGLTWQDMSGEDLFNLARGLASEISDVTRQWANGKQAELDRDRGPGKHNLSAVMDVAEYFHLSEQVYIWLLKYTNLGEIGRPPLMKLLRIRNEAKETKFKPKYPAEYVITKCLEP